MTLVVHALTFPVQRGPRPDPTGPAPTDMPARETLPRTAVIRPRACVSCTKHDPGRDRPHSLVEFFTASGTFRGGTKTWRPIDDWLAAQEAAGWTVISRDEDGSAYLQRDTDGHTQTIGPRQGQ